MAKIKVKVFRVSPCWDDDDCKQKLADGWTDWEEIDDKFYYELEMWARQSSKYGKYEYVVATPVDDAIPMSMDAIKKEIKKDKERKKKNKEMAAKRKATRERNKAEKEKALLEELKAKYDK